jgi:hypothetical protein
MSSKLFAPAPLLLIALACILSPGCAEPQQQQQRQVIAEAPPPPPEANPTPEIVTARSDAALPPELKEVGGAVERVFKGAVTIETGREPSFIVGNFNDDQSQDIAVVVKPTPGKLTEINDELAPWILVAPVQPAPKNLPYPAAHAEAIKRQRVQIEEGDVLLAVIHGVGSNGWRDAQATQTYVLKGSVGDKMKAQAYKQFLREGKGKGPLPRLRGDVIAQTVGGQSGFLYYNGAKYDWYDPRSYEPEAPAKMVHGGAIGSMQQ